MRARKITRPGTIELVRLAYDGVVGTDFEHVLTRLGRAAVDGKAVVGSVDGPPVGKVRLERSFDFPVFDEVLDEEGEAFGFVISGLGWKGVSGYSFL